MFGFAVNSKLINLDEDETYIKMSLTQYNILNEGKLNNQLWINFVLTLIKFCH